MDYAANREWLSNLCRGRDDDDDDDDDDGSTTMIVIAGDVSHDINVLRWTLRTLKSKYAEVVYTPGNHELWVDDDDDDGGGGVTTSIDKLERVLRLCLDEDVNIGPMRVGGGGGGDGNDEYDDMPHRRDSSLLVIPLLSWHHHSFDDEPEIVCWGGIPSARKASADYRRTIWPHPLSSFDDSVANFIDGLNDVILDLDDECHITYDDVDSMMTFSHFLPRIELIPEKRYLSLPTLHSCVGSTYLERRLRRLGEKYHIKKCNNDDVVYDNDAGTIGRHDDDGSAARYRRRGSHLHAFGHSHLAWDATIEGVRYVHVPLAYPREWRERSKSLVIGSMGGDNSISIGSKEGGGKKEGRGSVDGGDAANVRSPVCIWERPTAVKRASSSSSPSPSSAFSCDGFPPRWLGGWWSKYYAVTERQPHRNTELAPWAAKRYRQLPGGRIEDFDHVIVEERYLSSLVRKDNH
jgi:hypothetical protein